MPLPELEKPNPLPRQRKPFEGLGKKDPSFWLKLLQNPDFLHTIAASIGTGIAGERFGTGYVEAWEKDKAERLEREKFQAELQQKAEALKLEGRRTTATERQTRVAEEAGKREQTQQEFARTQKVLDMALETGVDGETAAGMLGQKLNPQQLAQINNAINKGTSLVIPSSGAILPSTQEGPPVPGSARLRTPEAVKLSLSIQAEQRAQQALDLQRQGIEQGSQEIALRQLGIGLETRNRSLIEASAKVLQLDSEAAEALLDSYREPQSPVGQFREDYETAYKADEKLAAQGVPETDPRRINNKQAMINATLGMRKVGVVGSGEEPAEVETFNFLVKKTMQVFDLPIEEATALVLAQSGRLGGMDQKTSMQLYSDLLQDNINAVYADTTIPLDEKDDEAFRRTAVVMQHIEAFAREGSSADVSMEELAALAVKTGQDREEFRRGLRARIGKGFGAHQVAEAIRAYDRYKANPNLIPAPEIGPPPPPPTKSGLSLEEELRIWLEMRDTSRIPQ